MTTEKAHLALAGGAVLISVAAILLSIAGNRPDNRSGCYEDEFRFGSLCYAYDNGRTPGTTNGNTK